MSTEAGPPPTIRYCISCGRAIDFNANVCSYCGHDYSGRGQIPFSLPPVRKSASPVIGGILVLIAGLLALVNVAEIMSLSEADYLNSGRSLPSGVTWDDVMGILQACAAIEIFFGIIAVVGGIFAIRRKSFGLAVGGAVMGMLGLGLGVGFILGLIGLILIAISKNDFH